MEKVETKTKQVKDYTHHFYCDSCGTHLGSSVEYDDGWYEEFGEFELQVYTPRGWYKLEKCFCDKCKDEFLNKLYSALEDAEFELD